MTDADVFVAYAQGTDEENEKVYSFVRMLRLNGYNATCDKKDMQESNSVSFTHMMGARLQCKRIIVILSRGYKEKADDPNAGVGKEYEVINIDRCKNPQKYIFVSFEGCSDRVREAIVPTMFQSIALLDLRKDEEQGFRELFARLNGQCLIDFGETAKTIPTVKPIKLPEFSLCKQKKFCVKNWMGKVIKHRHYREKGGGRA